MFLVIIFLHTFCANTFCVYFWSNVFYISDYSLTEMSEKALRDLNSIPETERKSESSSKACLTKPSADNADKNVEEWQKKKNCASLVSPPVIGNQIVNSEVEIGNAEVEYTESENLNDLEDIGACLKVLLNLLFLGQGV